MDNLLTLVNLKEHWEEILDFMKKEYSIQRASFNTWRSEERRVGKEC